MGRVFVSCSVHDRAAGERLGNLVRSLGHDSADDQDEAQGTAWWNEVVGRIEASDVFVAVASPSYAEAQSCRLAAKHAAAVGLPVVRVDLDGEVPTECHPVVAEAVGVPFAPDSPEAVARLAHALIAAPADISPPGTESVTATRSAREQSSEVPTSPSDPSVPGPSEGFRGVELGVALVVVLSALGLVYVGVSMLRHSDPGTVATHATPSVTPSVTQEPAVGGTTVPSSGPAPTTEVAALLAGVKLVGSDRLPVDACQAGATTVTCTRPAPNISTVVMTPYETPTELYAAYTAQVESLSGKPIGENTGNCSPSESEGELGWNLDKEHTFDFSITQHEQGGLDPASESAGRVFCTDHQSVMRLVWTQDPGLLVTATGEPSELVVTWWSEVHLQLACASGLDGTGCV